MKEEVERDIVIKVRMTFERRRRGVRSRSRVVGTRHSHIERNSPTLATLISKQVPCAVIELIVKQPGLESVTAILEARPGSIVVLVCKV